MTDFSNVEFLGPGAEAANERRRKALESRAQRAAAEQAKIEAFINGGPDPETGTAVSGPKESPAIEAPKPARTELEAKIRAARARIRKLRRKK